MRPRSLALPMALLAASVLASVAVAGGWAQVTAKNVAVDPPAGEAATIGLSVLQHGVTPVSWPRLTVVATDTASGAVVRAEATASGPEGSYSVKIVFPNAGEWRLTFESADLVMEGSAPIRIAPPVTAAPGTGTPVAQAFDVMPLVLALLAVVVVAGVAGLALRGRGASADAPVSART